LALTPLPFGALYQWSWSAFAIVVAVLLLISLVFHRGSAIPELRALWLPGGLFLLVVLWVAVQASAVTPEAWHHPIWAEASETLGEAASGAISLDPYASQSDLLKMLTFAGIFWLAAAYGHVRKRALAALWILGIAAVGYAAYGLAAQFSDLGSHLWFYRMPQHRWGVSSTFVNRNMYVIYAAFGLLGIITLLLNAWLSLGREAAGKSKRWTEMVLENQARLLLPLMMALVVMAALVMTGSRGGVLASGVATLVMLLSLIGGGKSGADRIRPLAKFALALAALWSLLFVMAGAHLGTRLAEVGGGGVGGRMEGYKLLASAIAEAPLTGYGAGTALDVFYLYNDGTFWNTFNYSHNLYLGAAVELGVPAAAALVTAVGLIVWSCLTGAWRRRRDQALPALGVSVAALVGVHGLVDSPLYLPANAATFSFLLGLAYAQSCPSLNRRPTFYDERSQHRSAQPPSDLAEEPSE
jgi:O-antigen ligase